MDWDVTPDWIRFNEVVVWGLYDGGAPPLTDSFRLRGHDTDTLGLPGPVACDETGITGRREVVGNVFGMDIYRHVLKLPQACTVTYFGAILSITRYWVELFNDTGPAGDWLWLAGYNGYAEPVGYLNLTVHANSAPGVVFSWIPTGRAFEINFRFPGESNGLRIAKLPDGEIRLEWSPDCGGTSSYSIYRGDLDAGYASLEPVPGLCDVSGPSVEFAAGEGLADFFLVVPFAESYDGGYFVQGSYGADSNGDPRPEPAAPNRCGVQQAVDDCAP